MIKILYLYNKDNWALHNVGRLWFSDTPNSFSVDLVNYHSIEDGFEQFCEKYDYVWFGYLYMYMKFNYSTERSIVSIHDPMELFPQVPGWKNISPIKENIRILQSLHHVVTISRELVSLLERSNIKSWLLSTTTLLPFRDCSEIKRGVRPVVIAISDDRPRKNLNLLYNIISKIRSRGIECNVKIGDQILPEDDYRNMLDTSNIYLCTSYQEGGPIPPMDAMARGCVIITTPVGQMSELIEDGVNGYICKLESEFLEKIIKLAGDNEMLYRMRIQAIKDIQQKRSHEMISAKVADLLYSLK